MYVSHLALSQFRSYEALNLEFEPGINALVGPNGHGKTNIIEAIGYMAHLESHRVASDAPLIRAGQDSAHVKLRVVRDVRASLLELDINAGRANQARINKAPVSKTREILGLLRSVLFAPEDLGLIKDGPDARRHFLNELMVTLLPRMAGVLSDYERVLKQRTALLKSAGGRYRDASLDLGTLDIWDAKLVELGTQIIHTRATLVEALRPWVGRAYEQVSTNKSVADLSYAPSLGRHLPAEESLGQDLGLISAQFANALSSVRTRELESGQSLVGPHRDDLQLQLGEFPVKGYASHGESWSFALALRIASYRVLSEPLDESVWPWSSDWGPDGEPVLILDDVFAELDAFRRSALTEIILPARQVLITAAVAEDLPTNLGGARFDVAQGEVSRVI